MSDKVNLMSSGGASAGPTSRGGPSSRAGGDARVGPIASGTAPSKAAPKSSASLRLLPLAIVLVAAIFRMWRLGDVPPGFQFDEAHNAIDAARFIDGIRPLFLPDNGGREVLLTWLHAPALAALGRDHPAFALRLVSAMVGTVTVALVGVVTGRVFGDRRLGWLAAAFLALMYWHLHFSRFAIRAILAPLWATGAIGAWWLATESNRERHAARPDVADLRSRRLTSWLKWSAVTGICLAAAVYSHPSGRLLPFILVAHAAYRILAAQSPESGRRLGVARTQFRALTTAGAVALLLFVPLGFYFLRHPELFTGHASDVSLAAVAARDHDGSIVRALLDNVWAIAGMFVAAGDPSTFHNLPDLPVYDPVTALLALFGAGFLFGGLLGRRQKALQAESTDFGGAHESDGAGNRTPMVTPDRAALVARDRAALVAAWLIIGLVPTLLSDRPPNYSRAIAAVPVVALLPALGLRWAMPLLLTRLPVPLWPRTQTAIIAAVLGIAGAWTGWHHFVSFPRIEHVYYSYDVEKLDALRALKTLEASKVESSDAESRATARPTTESSELGTEASSVFLHPLWARHATIDYLNRFVIPGMSGEIVVAEEGVADPDLLNGDPSIRMLDPRDTLIKPAGGGDVILAVPAAHEEREGVLESAATLINFAHRVNASDQDGNPPLAGSEPNVMPPPLAGTAPDVISSTMESNTASTEVILDALGAPLLSTLTLPDDLWGDLAPPTDAPLEPATWTTVRFNGAIDLLGMTIGDARTGEELPIVLVWRSLEPIGRDLTVFVHLIGPNGEPWGQDDREPGHTSYRTSDWRSGDVIIDRHGPVLAADATGELSVCVGWYDQSTGERLGAGDEQDAFCSRSIKIDRQRR